MSTTAASLSRRLAKLEATLATEAAEDEMIEIRKSPESWTLLGETFTGLYPPEQLAEMREEWLQPRLVNRAKHERQEAEGRKAIADLRAELKEMERRAAASGGNGAGR